MRGNQADSEHNGWSAVTKHRTPWEMKGRKLPAFDDVWELYDGRKHWTQARNPAKDIARRCTSCSGCG